MQERLRELRTELGGRLPGGLDALDAATLGLLLTQIRDAKASQARALDASITKGLAAVPALLRRPVKKVLFG